MSAAPRPFLYWIVRATAALGFAFLVATWHLNHDSLWDDEGWSLSAPQPPDAAEMLARVRADVHPPLYFALLDLWVNLAGESVYAVRLLSTFFGMIALAGTYALGKQFFNARTGLAALLILGTAGFFVYYTREARMYTLLLLWGVLATWAYWRWRARPTWRRGGVYGLLLAASLYTHYSGALIALTHGIHFLFEPQRTQRSTEEQQKHNTEEQRNRGTEENPSLCVSEPLRLCVTLFPYLLTLLLYAPWIPIIAAQFRLHEGRPLALAVPTDAEAVLTLIGIVTSAIPIVFGLLIGAGVILGWRRVGAQIRLLLLWMIVTPAVLLLLNVGVSPVYQVRYTIAMLPAVALLAAWGIDTLTHRKKHNTEAQRFRGAEKKFFLCFSVSLFLCVTLFIIVMQFLNYGVYWKPKSRYAEASRQLTAVRSPDEPLIADIYWAGVMAYYDRQDNIRSGTVLDVTRAPQTAAEARAMVAALNPAGSIWVVMPTNVPRTWDVVAALLETRGVGYRDTVMNMLFYRFDLISASAFQFRFGEMARFDGTITGRFTARRGEMLCINVPLTALNPVDERYSVSVQLLDVERDVMAAWDDGLGALEINQPIQLEPCLNVPDDLPDGDYYLQLALYDWRTLERLPLIEADNLYWGDALILGHVEP